MIRFNFNIEKSIQVASYFLLKENKRINYMKLLKLIYRLDKEALIRWKRTVTGDTIYSFKNGLAGTNLMDILRMQTESHEWNKFIKHLYGYDLVLVEVPDFGELSEREIKLMDKIYEEDGSKNQWVLSEEAHKLPEYIDPSGSSIHIPFETLLKNEGIPDEEIGEIEQDINSQLFAELILGK